MYLCRSRMYMILPFRPPCDLVLHSVRSTCHLRWVSHPLRPLSTVSSFFRSRALPFALASFHLRSCSMCISISIVCIYHSSTFKLVLYPDDRFSVPTLHRYIPYCLLRLTLRDLRFRVFTSSPLPYLSFRTYFCVRFRLDPTSTRFDFDPTIFDSRRIIRRFRGVSFDFFEAYHRFFALGFR
jgi:hypothetical protein